MSKPLADRVAIVTGASRGIGKEIALRLAADGAKVVLASRKAPALQAVAEQIKAQGGEALVAATHVGQPDQIKPLVEQTLNAFGKIDILVNNAATNPIFGPILFAELPALQKILEVNLYGAFLLSKACLEPMQKAKYGKIINIASMAGLHPSPGMGCYSISKAALLMMTRVMAAEWGTFGIRVNAVAPGLVKTDFSHVLWSTDDILKAALGKQALAGLAEPKDIVGAVVWLAGPESDFVTGHTLVVDGGSSI
jgi:NAD(P)-dependent dehydrogenase (short-subunit alcohol dehydrogenase family)